MEFDFDFDRQERRDKFKRFMFKFIKWVIAIGITVALAWAVSNYALEKTNLPDEAMAPTLMKEDTILINKAAYIKNEPERFDVIVFCKTGKEHSYYGIRRIIGLPGETVSIADGAVYINGEKLEEVIKEYEPMFLSGLADEGITLDEDEYFVLGDNRNNNEDSRFVNVGNVVREEIIGKAFLRINKFGIVSKLNILTDDDREKMAAAAAAAAEAQEQNSSEETGAQAENKDK